MKNPVNSKIYLSLLLLILILASWGGWLFFRPFFAPNKGIRNILLISIDTCRADHLSCYGYQKQTTPNIDQIAKEGVLFENAITPIPITLPAHSSMLTGTTPPYHGLRGNVGYKLAEQNSTLPEILHSRGFTTAGIVSAFVLNKEFGLSQGFDTYNDHFQEVRHQVSGDERRGEETSEVAIKWLEKNKDKKFFLFLHYYDPHTDYEPPEPFASEYSDNLYAGEIAYTDFCISKVIKKLKDLGLYESTLIIIAGDHGEMLGEHGEEDHRYFIYQSAIKVPLIFRLPGETKGKRTEQLVGLIDIVPTICSLLDIETPGQVQGKDLSAYLYGKQPPETQRHLYCESLTATVYDANPLHGIINQRYKYIQTTNSELYDLVVDPAEMNNLIKQQANQARILEDRLKQILELSAQNDPDSKVELDEGARKHLESLGYVTSQEGVDFEFDPGKNDPKDFIGFHVDFQRAVKLYDKGKYDEAKSFCTKLLPQLPRFEKVSLYLGKMALQENDFAGAIPHFNRALELNPDNYKAHNSLAKAYYQVRHFGLAVSHLKEVEKLKPDFTEATNTLVFLLATIKDPKIFDPQTAVKYALKACELADYKQPESLNMLAFAYAVNGNLPKAIETAQKALEIAVSTDKKDLAKEITKRLKLFKSKQQK